MPIYEYNCESCHTAFERMQKISDPTPACPECSSAEVKRLISRTSFRLKGGGWYAQDYGSTSPAKSSPAKSDAPSTGSEKTEKSPAASSEKSPQTEAKSHSCGKSCGCA